jgi:DNA-binding PadR family transcriptional regulator
MSRLAQPLSFEFILLGFLAEQPMHGYDLYKLINTDPNIGEIWMVKQAMMYAMLEKLEEQGLLSSEMINLGNYPIRKQYTITDNGRSAFDEWKSSPVDHPREIRQEFMARFYFSYRSDRQEARNLLKKQKQVCLQWLEMHQQHIAETEDELFSHLLIDFKQAQMESIMQWLDYCLGSLSE